jgi:hypothetical protein
MVRKEKILTEVIKIKSVKIVSSSKGKSTEVDAKFIITDTRMQVFLPQGLKAKGEQ